MAKSKMTAAQVQAALEVFDRDGGEPWTLIRAFMLQSIKRIDDLEAALKFVVGKCKEAGVLGAPSMPTNGHAMPAQEMVGAAPGPRIGADGTPLSAEQSMVEDQMDAAIAASGGQPVAPQRTMQQPPQPQAAPMSPQQQRPMPPRGGVRIPPGAGNQGAAPMPAPQGGGGVRIGADGTPLSPEQSMIEDQMDAAIAAMPQQR